MMIGIVLDLTGSWALTFGVLAIPCSIGLVITMLNREILEECYFAEMENRTAEE
jgi:hypothetical protein